ncbi:MAG: hypothetical protein MJZ76_08110, partial [Bacteroidales bacterium]|nr:hypothetical protein [Bacteroidales bacterium]
YDFAKIEKSQRQERKRGNSIAMKTYKNLSQNKHYQLVLNYELFFSCQILADFQQKRLNLARFYNAQLFSI